MLPRSASMPVVVAWRAATPVACHFRFRSGPKRSSGTMSPATAAALSCARRIVCQCKLTAVIRPVSSARPRSLPPMSKTTPRQQYPLLLHRPDPGSCPPGRQYRPDSRAPLISYVRPVRPGPTTPDSGVCAALRHWPTTPHRTARKAWQLQTTWICTTVRSTATTDPQRQTELLIPYNNYHLHDKGLKYAQIIQPAHINSGYIRYERHRVWEIEGELKPGQRHIYQKRTFFIDEDTWQIALADHYDARGELWSIDRLPDELLQRPGAMDDR